MHFSLASVDSTDYTSIMEYRISNSITLGVFTLAALLLGAGTFVLSVGMLVPDCGTAALIGLAGIGAGAALGYAAHRMEN
jgi:hypothetical protein